MYRICMITQSAYPFDPRVRRQAETLESKGYEVDIICIPLKNEIAEEKFGKITAYRVFKKSYSQEKMFKYLYRTFSFFILSFIKLQKLSKIHKYDLIQIHNMPEFHVFATYLQKMKKVPILLDIHDLTPELLEEKWPTKSKLLKPLVVFAEKASCKYSDKLLTVTAGCKEILISRGNPSEKIELILNTADTKDFRYQERDFKKIDKGIKLLYHGTVAERFGVHLVIEAMPLILKEIPDSKFIVHGKYDASYKNYLEHLINKHNLKNNVVLGSTKKVDELLPIMYNCDIEIVPYLSNKYMNLSLSTKLFECAAIGMPVISTKLNTIALTFGKDAIAYFEDRNLKDLAGKVIELARNPQLRKRLAINAFKCLGNISGDVMNTRYLSVIEDLMGVSKDNLNNTILRKEDTKTHLETIKL